MATKHRYGKRGGRKEGVMDLKRTQVPTYIRLPAIKEAQVSLLE